MGDHYGTHIVIPDTQVKPGVPTDHLRWAGQYIVDHFAGCPNVTIVHLGDHWDMPSLSSYDKGRKAMEGRRFLADVEAGNDGMKVLDGPLNAHNARKQAASKRQWHPRRILLRGNHEQRIERAVESDAQLDGLLSYNMLESPGWEVYDFLKPVEVDGVTYCHYFANVMTGKPLGGMAITRLKTLGYSFTMGHQQTYDHAIRFIKNRSQHALIAGSFYLHDEDYKGYQGNYHFRGLVVKHQVHDGAYDIMQISMDYLCRRYEGIPLRDWLRKNGYDNYSLAE